MNDIEFLELIARTMNSQPVEISTVKVTTKIARAGMIALKVNDNNYFGDTLDDCINMLKHNYAGFWLQHVKEVNEEKEA